MPTLREQLEFIIEWIQHNPRESYGHESARELEIMIRKHWPAERVYIAPADSRRDSDKSKAISEAAKRLPTGVVAARFGITAHAVRYHQRKKGKTPAA